MKKFASLFTIVLIYGLSYSCATPTDTTPAPTDTPAVAATATPAPTATATATPAPTATPKPTPTPVPTPKPTATPPLEQQTFTVEIDLQDAIVGFVQIDEGETQSLPLVVNLNGGTHKFFLGDVGTTCRIAKTVTVDKDHTKFKYTNSDCQNAGS
jgi:hypothetical protein